MKNSKIILINKKINQSSFKCIREVQKKYGYKKIGHAGTLDPMAQGLLIAMTNNATRLSDLLMKKDKIYYVKMKFGYETDTLDLEGSIVKHASYEHINIENIKDTIKEFIGYIEQEPPMYSAIKVNGEKLYNLARKNISVKIKKRNVNIYYIDNIEYIDNELSFRCKVSSGTYIRSLVRDIAYKLNTCATMTYLLREQIDDIKLVDDIEIRNVEDIIKLEKININDIELKKLLNGITIYKESNSNMAHCYYKENYLGIVEINNNMLKKTRFFLTQNEGIEIL